jgi:hypothetical protein
MPRLMTLSMLNGWEASTERSNDSYGSQDELSIWGSGQAHTRVIAAGLKDSAVVSCP